MYIRRLGVLFVLALALAGGGFMISTASAGSNLCPSARACIYDHSNWVGLLGTRGGGQTNWTNVSSGANDLTSSWENKTTTSGCWAYDSNGAGTRRNLAAGGEASYVGDGNNDKLTSWRTAGGC